MNRPQKGSSTASRTGTRGLQRYLITAVLVRLADEGARVGLVLLALERTKSAAVGGLLVAVLLIPQVVAAPAIGLLTDRARQPRWVLTISVAGFAASLAAVAFLLGRSRCKWLLPFCCSADAAAQASRVASPVSCRRWYPNHRCPGHSGRIR